MNKKYYKAQRRLCDYLSDNYDKRSCLSQHELDHSFLEMWRVHKKGKVQIKMCQLWYDGNYSIYIPEDDKKL